MFGNSKPAKGSKGKGICLFKNLGDLPGELQAEDKTVQKYLDKPLLLKRIMKGIKFDLRVYVVVVGIDPI